MAQERLGMREAREILRLKLELGRSDTEIAISVRRARSTVADCVARARAQGLTAWSVVAALSAIELEGRLYRKTANANSVSSADVRVLPDFAELHAELKRHKKLTLQLLWEEYKAVYPNGYQYTRFTELYANWKKKLSASMRQEHRAGERTFVDYCDGLYLTNRESGEKTSTELYVGCLGASSYTYAEASHGRGGF